MGLAFPFPFIDVLTLPTDATTGTRIVLDGVNGQILLYNSSNQLVGSWIPSALVVQEGSGGDFIQLLPSFTPSWGGNVPAIRLNNSIILHDDNVVGPGDGVAITDFVTNLGDLLIEGPSQIFQSIARGHIKSFASTSNSSGFTADTTTDMVVSNVEVVADRLYQVHLHTQYDLSAAGVWNLNFRVNGTVTDRFAVINEGAAKVGTIDASVYWRPTVTTTTDDVDLAVDEVAGASTLTLQAAATARRTLAVIDVGR